MSRINGAKKMQSKTAFKIFQWLEQILKFDNLKTTEVIRFSKNSSSVLAFFKELFLTKKKFKW